MTGPRAAEPAVVNHWEQEEAPPSPRRRCGIARGRAGPAAAHQPAKPDLFPSPCRPKGNGTKPRVTKPSWEQTSRPRISWHLNFSRRECTGCTQVAPPVVGRDRPQRRTVFRSKMCVRDVGGAMSAVTLTELFPTLPSYLPSWWDYKCK